MQRRWWFPRGLFVVMAAVLAPGCGPTEPSPGTDDEQPDASTPMPDGNTTMPGDPDAASPDQPDARPPASAEPGASCACDADCADVGGQDGVCVYGICMIGASSACSEAGSQDECPDGSRCWGLQGHEGSICWPDCDAYTCDGACDADGSCVPESDADCDYTCGSYCACEPGDCADGDSCVSGACVPEAGDGPGAGPGPACPNLPDRDCQGSEAYCGALVTFDPRVTPHYDDYPINGETNADQYRSYLRRDLRMLIDYATAKVLCKAADWDTGIGGALGLGDMSEANGAIPGTSVGSPGHPQNTHTDGYDIDLAYYQIGQPNNYLRPICPHTQGGDDVYHCVSEPDTLDVWRTALFLGAIFESSRVRVVGVDGQAGPLLTSALETLCSQGWVEQAACNDVALAYETTDMGYGWYYFHHHHAHISLEQVASAAPAPDAVMPCIDAGCASAHADVKALPQTGARFRIGPATVDTAP